MAHPPYVQTPHNDRQHFLTLTKQPQARQGAWVASVFAAGGPAPITVTPFTAKELKEEQSPALKVASASACMVAAWAALREPEPRLEEAEGIAANARRHNGKRCDAYACQTDLVWHENVSAVFVFGCLSGPYLPSSHSPYVRPATVLRSTHFLAPSPCIHKSIYLFIGYGVAHGNMWKYLASTDGNAGAWATVARTLRARYLLLHPPFGCSWEWA